MRGATAQKFVQAIQDGIKNGEPWAILIVLGILVGIVWLIYMKRNNRKLTRIFREGVEHLENKDWNKAIDSFSKALEIDEKDYESFFNRSYAYEAVGKLNEAWHDAIKANSLKPPDDTLCSERLKDLDSKMHRQ